MWWFEKRRRVVEFTGGFPSNNGISAKAAFDQIGRQPQAAFETVLGQNVEIMSSNDDNDDDKEAMLDEEDDGEEGQQNEDSQQCLSQG